MNTKTLSWIGLILGFLLFTGIISANTVFKTIGLILLVVAFIFIMKDSK